MTRAPDKNEKKYLLIYAIEIFSTFNYRQYSISFG